MARKKPNSEGKAPVPQTTEERPRTSKKPNRTKVSLAFWVDPELSQAFNKFLDSLPFRPSLSKVGTQAIEEFLSKHGFWPPSE